MSDRRRTQGQGMTEYIIIVALIAIAAIAVVGIFGNVVREQVGTMAESVAGVEATRDASGALGGLDEAAGQKGLQDFSE